MTKKDQLLSDMKQAMKDKNAERLSTLRMVVSAMKNEEIDSQKELDDAGVEKVIARQIKQLKDALSDFEKAGRDDLTSQTKKEIAILEVYMPAQMSKEELRSIVEKSLASMPGITQKDMGRVMGAVMKDVQGRADGNNVRAIVQELLAGT